MGHGISEILTFAVGVAISPVPILAVTLMLFSQRARVNGPVFLPGWVVALAIVSGVVYVLADQGDAATDSTTSDAIAWGKIVFGALFLLLAVRNWRSRRAPGVRPEMPKWMSGIDALKPGKALGLGLLLAGVNPKNLMLAAAAGAGLAQLGLSTGDAVGSLVVFVVIGSLTIAGPVVYQYVGRQRILFTAELDAHTGVLEAWRLPGFPRGHRARRAEMRRVQLAPLGARIQTHAVKPRVARETTRAA